MMTLLRLSRVPSIFFENLSFGYRAPFNHRLEMSLYLTREYICLIFRGE